MMKTQYLKWSQEEARLISREIDRELGKEQRRKISWVAVAETVETKTPRECYDWYEIRKNRDTFNMHRWSKDEVELVKHLMECGCTPREISDRVGGVSISETRNKIRYLRELEQQKVVIDVKELEILLAQLS